MTKVLVVSFSPIHSDARVLRQIRALSGLGEVSVVGFFGGNNSKESDVIAIDVPTPSRSWMAVAVRYATLLTRQYEFFYWRLGFVQSALAACQDKQYDLIVANDLMALPVAARIANSQPIVVDLHEYSPKEFEDRWLWRLTFRGLYEYIGTVYLRRVNFCSTVCQGIADEYRREYGISPRVIFNIPDGAASKPHTTGRPVAQSRGRRMRFVHHGLAIPSRRLEVTIQAFLRAGPDFELDLYLVGDDLGYMRRLKELAGRSQSIRFLSPVPPRDITQTLACYDLGIFFLPPINFNYKHALPNKFFEFIHAGVPVLIGPSPEMANIVRQYGIGEVTRDFTVDSLVESLHKVSSSSLQQYFPGLAAAAEVFSAQSCRDATIDLARDALNSRL